MYVQIVCTFYILFIIYITVDTDCSFFKTANMSCLVVMSNILKNWGVLYRDKTGKTRVVKSFVAKPILSAVLCLVSESVMGYTQVQRIECKCCHTFPVPADTENYLYISSVTMIVFFLVSGRAGFIFWWCPGPFAYHFSQMARSNFIRDQYWASGPLRFWA